jgi:type 1 fimbriae regulatory protein FimB/type 1 fimbriae regulatory protein FimE
MTGTSPTAVNRTLPTRLSNSAYRVREYLTEKEVDRLIEAARKRGRNGVRDAAAILLAYRHGLRASELCALRWAQVDLRNGRLHVNRAKGGIESVHPLHGPELRALRPLQQGSPYVFVTEAGTPVTPAWFLRMIQRTNVPAWRRSFRSRFIPTCCGIPQGISLRMMARIHGAWRIIWATGICNQQLDILRLRRIGLRSSGGIRVWGEPLERNRRIVAPGAFWPAPSPTELHPKNTPSARR